MEKKKKKKRIQILKLKSFFSILFSTLERKTIGLTEQI